MNAPAFKRPITPLVAVCPEYAAALDEFERLQRADKLDEAAKAWTRCLEAAEEFRRHHQLGVVEGGKK